MKRMVLVGALVGALAASSAFAQPTTGGRRTATRPRSSSRRPKPAPTAPEGSVQLGTVRIPKGVKADGKPLAAGTYQVRLTPQTASPDAKGQTASLERWAEFVKGGKVVGREVVTIIPQAEISEGPEGHAAAERRLEGRNAEGRRLHPRLDQPRRQSLSDALPGV